MEREQHMHSAETIGMRSLQWLHLSMPMGIGEDEVGGNRGQSQRVLKTLPQARSQGVKSRLSLGPRDRPQGLERNTPRAEVTGLSGWRDGAEGEKDGVPRPVSRGSGTHRQSGCKTSLAMAPKVTGLTMCQDSGRRWWLVGSLRPLPTHNSIWPVQNL